MHLPSGMKPLVVQRHLTKTEIALDALRERISSGELAPGSRLRVEDLADDLAMSPTPIREALRLLQAAGLVDYRPHHGIVVAERTVDEIKDLFRLRSVLEPLALELAVPRLDEATLQRLERIHEQLAEAARANRGRAIARCNSDWHWTIYEASGSPLLVDIIHRLWEAFPWRTMWALPGRSDLSLRQHAAMMKAIRQGDAARAAELLREHVVSGEATLLPQLEGDGAARSATRRVAPPPASRG
jgi:DNA-binding GntR family transcriptional regulator